MPDRNLTYEQASELYDRVSLEASTRNSRARRYRVTTAVVILVAGVGCLSAYFAVFSGDFGASHGAKQRAYFGFISPTWQPRVTGPPASTEKAISLTEAKAQADIPVLAPSKDAVSAAVPDLISGAPATEPASDGSTPPDDAVRVIWLDHQGAIGAPGDLVHIEYNHLEITEVQMDSTYDGPRSYRGMVDQQADPNAYLGIVQSSTAYVAPPNNKEGTVHPGYVMFMKGNVQIIVEGYYPATDLVAIANSLS
ncbi:MAG: hypothetical protein ABSC51_07145 [Gaiellaceae bacterium]|jgi:hypothetical protein